MASVPRENAKSQATGKQPTERLTPLERAIERAHIDVAAIIRWTFFGIAAVLAVLVPLFTDAPLDAPLERTKAHIEKVLPGAADVGKAEPVPQLLTPTR